MRTTLEIAGLGLIVALLSSCVNGNGLISVPTGTRKITTWGAGCIPTGGWCIPAVFYWASDHGSDTENFNPAKPPLVKGPIEATKP